MNYRKKLALAYLIGVALGDGNLSNPNGRAIRLRITCFIGYPRIAEEMKSAIHFLLPNNKVSVVKEKTRSFYISVYSNKLMEWIPWKVGCGTKIEQSAKVPSWIKTHPQFSKACLRGLIQTDGSIYRDRGYLMVNFTNHNKYLAEDVYDMLIALGFQPTVSKIRVKNGHRFTIRIARKIDAQKLISNLDLYKK